MIKIFITSISVFLFILGATTASQAQNNDFFTPDYDIDFEFIAVDAHTLGEIGPNTSEIDFSVLVKNNTMNVPHSETPKVQIVFAAIGNNTGFGKNLNWNEGTLILPPNPSIKTLNVTLDSVILDESNREGILYGTVYFNVTLPTVCTEYECSDEKNVRYDITNVIYLPKASHLEKKAIKGEAINPWQRNANGHLGTDRTWNYTMGYHFQSLKDGQITKLGGFFNGAKKVILWNKDTGELLASTTATAANNWGYANITPVEITAGTNYTVAVYINSSGGSVYSYLDPFPQTYGDIKIMGSTYVNGDQRPINNSLNRMYGQADIEFIPSN